MHHIQAVVARSEDLRELPELTLAHRVVPLPQGFGLIPATQELLEHLDVVYPSNAERARVNGFLKLSWGLVSFLRLFSHRAPVAYIETEYFGGVGVQSAAAYMDGRDVFAECEAKSGHPISHALSVIGVRSEGLDEFDALGLGRFRSMGAFDERG